MTILNRDKPYQQFIGATGVAARYAQDGKKFDGAGNEIIKASRKEISDARAKRQKRVVENKAKK